IGYRNPPRTNPDQPIDGDLAGVQHLGFAAFDCAGGQFQRRLDRNDLVCVVSEADHASRVRRTRPEWADEQDQDQESCSWQIVVRRHHTSFPKKQGDFPPRPEPSLGELCPAKNLRRKYSWPPDLFHFTPVTVGPQGVGGTGVRWGNNLSTNRLSSCRRQPPRHSTRLTRPSRIALVCRLRIGYVPPTSFGQPGLQLLEWELKRPETGTMSGPRLLITMGDVAGIGPEIIAKAWPELVARGWPVVVGDPAWLRR